MLMAVATGGVGGTPAPMIDTFSSESTRHWLCSTCCGRTDSLTGYRRFGQIRSESQYPMEWREARQRRAERGTAVCSTHYVRSTSLD
jgi:hypothetical protein